MNQGSPHNYLFVCPSIFSGIQLILLHKLKLCIIIIVEFAILTDAFSVIRRVRAHTDNLHAFLHRSIKLISVAFLYIILSVNHIFHFALLTIIYLYLYDLTVINLPFIGFIQYCQNNDHMRHISALGHYRTGISDLSNIRTKTSTKETSE